MFPIFHKHLFGIIAIQIRMKVIPRIELLKEEFTSQHSIVQDYSSCNSISLVIGIMETLSIDTTGLGLWRIRLVDMSYKLFSALFIKSHILLNIRHTSHYKVLTRCEPPQSNVQSNIWMEKSYEHTDPYQSSRVL